MQEKLGTFLKDKNISVLINNAGIIKRTPLIEMEVADFKQVIDVDLVSPFQEGLREGELHAITVGR